MLSSLYRATAALPDPRILPNVEFIIDCADTQDRTPHNRTAWVFARRHNQHASFLMPDFDGWAYPDDDVGGYQAFRTKVRDMEKENPFDSKLPQVAWRGSTGVNHELRQTLINVTQNKTWADVKALDWVTGEGFVRFPALLHSNLPQQRH